MLYQRNAKFDHAFAILRFDADMVEKFGMRLESIMVKEVVWTEEAANREVERLNRLNSDKGSIYFWQLTRVARDREAVHSSESGSSPVPQASEQ